MERRGGAGVGGLCSIPAVSRSQPSVYCPGRTPKVHCIAADALRPTPSVHCIAFDAERALPYGSRQGWAAWSATRCCGVPHVLQNTLILHICTAHAASAVFSAAVVRGDRAGRVKRKWYKRRKMSAQKESVSARKYRGRRARPSPFRLLSAACCRMKRTHSPRPWMAPLLAFMVELRRRRPLRFLRGMV